MTTAVRPVHGVSGFQTTGAVGDYQFQFHDHMLTRSTDPSSSRYSVQERGTARIINKDGDNFTMPFNEPGTADYIPKPNLSFYNAEATYAEEEQANIATASQIKSHVMQRSRVPDQPSYLADRMYDGFGQHDPAMQRMIRDSQTSQPIAMFSPTAKRHTPFNPTPNIRQNGVDNPSFSHKPPPPQDVLLYASSNANLPDTNVSHTPEIKSEFEATGTHPTQGGGGGVTTVNDQPPKPESVMTIFGSITPRSTLPYMNLPAPPTPDVRPMSGPRPMQASARPIEGMTVLNQRFL